MNEQEYREFVSGLRNDNLDCSDVRLLHGIIGISAEAGELLDIIKRQMVYHKTPDAYHVREELGDLLHYMFYVMDKYDFTLEDLMNDNVAKLRIRYPEGYSNQAALERKDKS